jgi:disulfide bond formation protein DsbB
MRWLNNKNFSAVVALCSLMVLAIPVGIANMWLGYVVGESPCTLCWNERIGMVVVGILALFMVVYGPKLKYIGAMMICSAYGLWMTGRHTSLDGWSWDVGMGFGTSLFGAHTYTWGVVVYWAVIFVTGIILMMTAKDKILMADLSEAANQPKALSSFTKIVFVLSLIVIGSNGIQALFQNGVPPFSGKGEPERFTMDLSTASQRWTTGVWNRLSKPISLKGKNAVDDAYLAGASAPSKFTFNEKTEDSPFVNVKPALPLIGEKVLPVVATGFKGKGNAAGISFNPKSGMYAVVSNEAGIYFLDKDMKKVLAKGILDKVNGYDIPITADTVWVGGKVINVASNKTLWAVEPADKVDSFRDWNTFRESTGNLKTSWYRDRPVVTTVRAKKSYVTAAAVDETGTNLYFITVPNDVTKKAILVKVDSDDLMPTAENNIKASSSLALKAKRNVNDLYAQGLVWYKGKLLAYSKQYNVLVVINPENGEILDAYGMPKLSEAHSLTVEGDRLVLLGRKDGKDIVYFVSAPSI